MTVWGTSAGARNGRNGNEEWTYIDNQVKSLNGGYGHKARRSYDQEVPTNFNNCPAASDIGKRISAFSIHTTEHSDTGWYAMANGNYDAKLRSLVNSVPSGHKVYLIYSHEPENDGGSPQTLWRPAWARFAKVVLDCGNSNVIPTFNLMAYTWDAASRNPNDYNPARNMTAAETAACLGTVDAYTRPVEGLFGEPYADIISWGFRGFGIMEMGQADDPSIASWMLDVEDWVNAHPKTEIACWWHSGFVGSEQFWLDTTQAGLETWADIIGRNQGANIPVTQPPATELPPSSSTGNPTGTVVVTTGNTGGYAASYASGGLPSFGTPAFVNTDDPPSQNPDEPVGAVYYSDWGTWNLPYCVYTVNNQCVAVWWNNSWSGDTMTLKWQCRVATPTDPVTLGEVLTLYEITCSNYPTNWVNMYDQQTMGAAVVGSDLYLNVGVAQDGGSEIKHRVFVRVDCSGTTPTIGAIRDDVVTTHAVTYTLASINGSCIGVPMYSGTIGGSNNPIVKLDADLNFVWQDTTWGETVDDYQVKLLASSDTGQTWLLNWFDEFFPVLVGDSGVTVTGPGQLLTDTSVAGVTVPFNGNPTQISQNIILSDVTLYPAIRGWNNNGMLLTNYGFLVWNVWYDGSAFQYETGWMFDFPSRVSGDTLGYGYPFSNGPAFGLVGNSPESLIMFLPRLPITGTDVNDLWLNKGLDAEAEEQLATFKHEAWAVSDSWAAFAAAAQVSSGAGILLMRAGYGWDEYGTYWSDGGGTEGAGKIMAIPFFLGAPNLSGEYEESRRKFTRSQGDYGA